MVTDQTQLAFSKGVVKRSGYLLNLRHKLVKLLNPFVFFLELQSKLRNFCRHSVLSVVLNHDPTPNRVHALRPLNLRLDFHLYHDRLQLDPEIDHLLKQHDLRDLHGAHLVLRGINHRKHAVLYRLNLYQRGHLVVVVFVLLFRQQAAEAEEGVVAGVVQMESVLQVDQQKLVKAQELMLGRFGLLQGVVQVR